MQIIMKQSAKFLLGTILMSLGISLSYFANLGTDALSVLVDGVHTCSTLSYGTSLIIINLLLLAVLVLRGRHFLKLGLLISCFLPSIFIDIFTVLLRQTLHTPIYQTLAVRLLVLAIGIVITCCGLGGYLSSGLGASPSDSIHLLLADQFGWKYCYIRITSDIICLAIGWLLGGTVGVGTIISTAFLGYLADKFYLFFQKI